MSPYQAPIVDAPEDRPAFPIGIWLIVSTVLGVAVLATSPIPGYYVQHASKAPSS